ncbi:MAG: hypothetical protein IKU68_02845 [Oscillospiraceae bacterium]|nr:hypothetical protein [Oscillospiraceae bacterium]
MRFKDYFSLKNLFFSVALFAILIPFAIRDSNNQVKVYFDDASVRTTSNKYTLTIPYGDIVSAELTDLAEPGQKVTDGYDDDILRAGLWQNETWGEYHITADLDATNCILITLNDGRVFVFSSVNNETTAEHFETLQSHLS